MSNDVFARFAGKNIKIDSPHFYGYVPTEDEYEDMAQECAEDLHPDEELEDGWRIAAISGAMEMGEMVQMDGFLAVNDEDGSFYVCDEGSIENYDEPVSELVIELDED